MLRIYGFSLTQVPEDHVKKVFEVAQLCKHDNGLSSIKNGYYYGRFNESDRVIEFVRVNDSHADTWSSLLKMICFIEQRIPKTSALENHKQLAAKYLADIVLSLKHNNSQRGNWLSKVRNSVNYRFSHQAWFPFGGEAIDPSFAENRAIRWSEVSQNHSYNEKQSEMRLFFETCFAIVNFCQCTFRHTVDRNSDRPSYLNNGSCKLLNLLSVPLSI